MIIAVLAAGESKRFGSPKQLSKFKEKSLLQATLDNLPQCDEVCLILGAYKDDIEKSLDLGGLTILENNDYKNGLSTSVKIAMDYAQEKNHDLLITLGDLPLVTKENYQDLMDQMTTEPVFSGFKDTHGPPVVIPKERMVFSKYLDGDKGLKNLYMDYEVLPMPAAGFDIDTLEDLNKI